MKITGQVKNNLSCRKTAENGSSLIETCIVIVFVSGFFLGIIELFLLLTTKFVTLDAAQSAVRSAVVQKDPQISALYVLSSRNIPEKTIPFPVVIESNKNNKKIITAKLQYLQKVSFPSYFTFSRTGMIPSVSYCPMSASPEPKLFDRAFIK